MQATTVSGSVMIALAGELEPQFGGKNVLFINDVYVQGINIVQHF